MRLLRSEDGNALVELALFLPLLTFLFVGVVDYGLEIQQKMKIAEAAAAGAAFGAMPGNAKNYAGMQLAATNSATGVTGFSAVASTVYTCTPGGTVVSSGSSCTGYGTPITYVQVKASATVPTMLSFPGMPINIALQHTASYRVPWQP